ncbi:TlpA family protein disulfide reductase [Amnibacterium kyonggiense]|uniref:Thiol-disulfide isomerase/thioredoxin n=1 Tax=Amnibacterium kyonggiense TaxID=595671 RepID=A0A4R7FPI3_9MICO|nr:TlpA disulfide reductase family protein [Amnibacterium kyonggiense]TDS79652.1 thiol-disulfide isomerase/thioredoxin [Amnibacterium kyonggiense]
MRRRAAVLAAPLLAALLLLTGCTQAGPQGGPGDVQKVAGDGVAGIDQWKDPSSQVVDFSGRTPDGTTITSKQYRGKVVVVNFWYASCPPCIAEAPTLSSLATEYKGDVQFVGVNVSDDADTTALFERNHKTPYPSVVDQDGGASVQLAFAQVKPPKAVPSTFVLDRKGRVTARMVGLANKSNLNQLIEDALDGTAK